MRSTSNQPVGRQTADAALSPQQTWCLQGTSGASYRSRLNGQPVVNRYTPDKPLPLINRQREYRLLNKLAKRGMAVKPIVLQQKRLILPWQPGHAIDHSLYHPDNPVFMNLLRKLHQQPLSGYPLNIPALLQQYWQYCQHKSHRWQRALNQLISNGKPHPIRTGLLHMDIHPGNIIQHNQALFLIDWEYAGDGDIALELASIGLQMAEQQDGLIKRYAQMMNLDRLRLQRQVARWQPWLRLLIASWYQLRAEQTADPRFYHLALQSWQHI